MKIEELLEKHGIPYRAGGQHRHVRHGWIGVDCPWCGSVDKWHLGINQKSGGVVCWKCGKHSLASALAAVVGVSPSEGYHLASKFDRQHIAFADPYEARGKLKLPYGIEPELPKAHQNYLKRRGFNVQHLERLWGIRGIAMDSADYAWRLWLPVIYRGETVSWTTRSIRDGGTRYLHAPPSQEALPIKSLLYGVDYVANAIIVTEGPTDVWNVGPGSVCVWGLQISPPQLHLLVKYPIRYFCFDNSKEAKRRAQHWADLSSVFPGETYVVELDADDPGSAARSEVIKLRKSVFGAAE